MHEPKPSLHFYGEMIISLTFKTEAVHRVGRKFSLYDRYAHMVSMKVNELMSSKVTEFPSILLNSPACGLGTGGRGGLYQKHTS